MKLVSSLIAKRCMECLEAFASGKIVLRTKQTCFGQYLEEKSSKITHIFGFYLWEEGNQLLYC